MKRFFTYWKFYLHIELYRSTTNLYWKITQFHPENGFRIRPSYKEWFDENIQGPYRFNESEWSFDFALATDAILFKLTFS